MCGTALFGPEPPPIETWGFIEDDEPDDDEPDDDKPDDDEPEDDEPE